MSNSLKKDKPKLEVVILDTKAWTRSENCNKYGKCCAIGFIAKNRLMRAGNKHPTIMEIDDETNRIATVENLGNLTSINDAESGKRRIKLLRAEFKKLGFRAIFKNLS